MGAKGVEQWIFVTGVPRSGTTFVGQVLSLPLEVDYIHEPFNRACGMPGMPGRDFYVRPSLDTPEMQELHEKVKLVFDYDFTLRTTYHSKDPWLWRAVKSVVGSRGPFYLRLAKINPFRKAALIKDPTASFFSEYLASCFGVKPVIVLKHPVSLVASLQRVGWEPDLRWIRQQQPLIDDYFAGETDFLFKEWGPPVLAAAAHWRAAYKVLLDQARRHPDWLVLPIEEVSQHPVDCFKHAYEALNLRWSRRVERRIRKMTSARPSAEARAGRVQDLHRNSAKLFEKRRDSIPIEQRRLVFDIVKDVALPVYPRESFAID